MYGVGSLFTYYSRRAQQEQVAAINAVGAAAASAHSRLSALLATKALIEALDDRDRETAAAVVRLVAVAA